MFRFESDPPAAYLFNSPISFDPDLGEVTYSLDLLHSMRIEDYPDTLHSNIHVPHELQVIGARSYVIYREGNDGRLQFSLAFGNRNAVWKDGIGVGALYQAIRSLGDMEDFLQSTRIDYDNTFLDFYADLGKTSESDVISLVTDRLRIWRKVVERAERHLLGFRWRAEYEFDEAIFTEEVVIPVFRGVGYSHVRYNHGPSERGRDILFSEVDKFGRVRHGAAQVKAGDLTQSNGVLLEKLRCQIDDAFALPVVGPGQDEQFYIADFYVVVSGKITEEAIVRLNGKIDSRLIGSVHYLHRGHIESLAHRLLLRRG